jgi:N6-adenosine-specific RNA methylase IME4
LQTKSDKQTSTKAPKGALAGQHSKKPEVFMDLIERVSPQPRLELFARRQRLGWDTWGNESLNHVELTAGGR